MYQIHGILRYLSWPKERLKMLYSAVEGYASRYGHKLILHGRGRLLVKLLVTLFLRV